MSIYFTLIVGRIGCISEGYLVYLVCMVCRVVRNSFYMVVVSGCCVDVLGSAPEDYAS